MHRRFAALLLIAFSACIPDAPSYVGRLCGADSECRETGLLCIGGTCQRSPGASGGGGTGTGGGGATQTGGGTGGSGGGGLVIDPSRGIVVTPPGRAPFGVRSYPLTLARAADGGLSALTVAITANDAGEVGAAIDSLGPTTAVSFAAGAMVSAPFVYRGTLAGTVQLGLDAGAGVTVDGTLLVGPEGIVADGEGPLLYADGPMGAFESFHQARTGVQLSVSPGSAKRGTGGYLIDDTDGTTNNGSQAALVTLLRGFSREYYARAWVRVREPSSNGSFVLMQIYGPGTPAGMYLEFPGGRPKLGGSNLNGNSTFDGTSPGIADGGWHLIEIGADGLGTTAGRRRMWVDGELSVNRNGQDFSGMLVNQFSLGESWSDDARFTGKVDVDDVRTSIEPPASRLRLSIDAVSAGACSTGTVSLVDSSTVLAPAVEDTFVTLESSASSLQVFTDRACTATSTELRIPRGAKSAGFSFKLSSGSAPLTARSDDFYPFTATITVP